jgi:hypothetical protein
MATYTQNNTTYSINYPKEWVAMDEEKECGPGYCSNCTIYGSFEEVFYGLCLNCSGDYPNFNHGNINSFIIDLQSYVDELKKDYPNDEYGLVQEAIEEVKDILDMRTKAIYTSLRELELEQQQWNNAWTEASGYPSAERMSMAIGDYLANRMETYKQELQAEQAPQAQQTNEAQVPQAQAEQTKWDMWYDANYSSSAINYASYNGVDTIYVVYNSNTENTYEYPCIPAQWNYFLKTESKGAYIAKLKNKAEKEEEQLQQQDVDKSFTDDESTTSSTRSEECENCGCIVESDDIANSGLCECCALTN